MNTTDWILFALRWIHFFAGIIWIGMLYYFNFVQGPFFAETDAATKSAATQKLVPRALWWFRWGAMFTFLSGAIIIMGRAHTTEGILATDWGVKILTGGILGTLMWANVWFVIWPNQKVVIASATQVAGGGAAIPDAASRAARAGVASRTNVLFSIPMLFFMGAATHLPINMSAESNTTLYWIIFAIIAGGLEINALKGGMGPMKSISGVIHCGFALALVIFAAMMIVL